MLSVFDIFSVGIGPSSSHTVGPMKAAKWFCDELLAFGTLHSVARVNVELYGSLGQTGIGHGTGKAIILGLSGLSPDTVDPDEIEPLLHTVSATERLMLGGIHQIVFPRSGVITFHRRKALKQHANGMKVLAYTADDSEVYQQTYFSIGGGFVVKESEFERQRQESLQHLDIAIPYPFNSANDILKHCREAGMSITTLMLKNEAVHLSQQVVEERLFDIWLTMKACIDRGCITEGILPGGLKVQRRAPSLHRRLQAEKSVDPLQVMDWVNLFALAVNEENAAGSRVVTAPTNGAAGIIPAVMMYYDKFIQPLTKSSVSRFLLTSAAIGMLYKQNASISGAEVGCQGEVGVACSMAAAGLTELLGGSVTQIENAAEIGMEHNLGLTCDPIGGLVQVPCIERNAMGAVKAINAARLALRGSGEHKVSLDKVIKTMWDTGKDMQSKYKETSRGGLAVNIIEC